MRQADQTTRESFSAVQRPFITAIGLNFSQQGYGASTPQYWLFRVRSNSEPRSSSQVTGSRARSFSRAAISRVCLIHINETDSRPRVNDKFSNISG